MDETEKAQRKQFYAANIDIAAAIERELYLMSQRLRMWAPDRGRIEKVYKILDGCRHYGMMTPRQLEAIRQTKDFLTRKYARQLQPALKTSV